MKKSFFVTIVTIFSLLVIAANSSAWTAVELDHRGQEHFRLAFYEMTPQNDAAGALQEYQLAEQDFLDAIQLAPDWVEPYLHMGRTCFVQKKQVQQQVQSE